MKKEKLFKSSLTAKLIACFAILFLISSTELKSQSKLDCTEMFVHGYSTGFEYKYSGQDDNCLYFVLNYIGRSVYVKSLNKDSELLEISKKIKLPSNYNDSKIVKIYCENGNMYILSYFNNHAQGKNFIFRESINLKTAKSNNDLVKIAEMDEISKDISWKLVESNSKKYIALLFLDTKKYEYINSEIFVMDNKFNLISQTNNFYNKLLGANVVDDLIISDDAQVFSLFRQSTIGEKNAFDGEKIKVITLEGKKTDKYVCKQNYSFHFMFKSKNGNSERYNLIPPDGKFIKYATTFTIDTLSFICGTLSLNSDLNNYSVFCYKFNNPSDHDIKIVEQNENVISEDLKVKYLESNDRDLYNEAQTSEKSKLWDYHDLQNVGIIKFNHGYLLLIEKVMDYLITMSSGKTTTTIHIGVNDYVYGIFVNENGEIKNLFIIPKKQSKAEGSYFISTYWVKNDKFYFLFSPISHKTAKLDNTILYEYDTTFNRETINIPSQGIYENGIFTKNTWLTEDSFLGYSVQNEVLGTVKFLKIKNDF